MGDVGLVLADNAVAGFLVGLLIDDCNPRAEHHLVAGNLRRIDHLRPRDLVLKLRHAALDEGLPVAGRMVFGILGQVPVLARLGNRPHDGRPLDRLQPAQLLLHPAIAFRRHRHLVHLSHFPLRKSYNQSRNDPSK